MRQKWLRLALFVGTFALATPVWTSVETAQAATEEHADDAHGGELTLHGVLSDKEFWGTLVNFAALIVLLSWAIRKKINPALKERADAVQAELAEAQRLRAEAEAKRREADERIKQLDATREQMIAEMSEAGKVEQAQMVAQAEEKAARMRRDTSFLIEQQLKQLRADLTREATKAAIDAAEEILTAKTNDDDQRRLASDYLNRLVEVSSERQS